MVKIGGKEYEFVYRVDFINGQWGFEKLPLPLNDHPNYDNKVIDDYYSQEDADKCIKKHEENEDMVLLCKDCGQQFLFTKDEEKWYVEHNMQSPKRCCSCRTKRKRDANIKTEEAATNKQKVRSTIRIKSIEVKTGDDVNTLTVGSIVKVLSDPAGTINVSTKDKYGIISSIEPRIQKRAITRDEIHEDDIDIAVIFPIIDNNSQNITVADCHNEPYYFGVNDIKYIP